MSDFLDEHAVELEGVYNSFSESSNSVHPGMSQDQWLKFVRDFELLSLGSLREMRSTFRAQLEVGGDIFI